MPTLLAPDTLTTLYGVHPSILRRVTALFTQDALTPTQEDVAQILALHSKQGLGLELTRAYQVFLLLRAVHTLGIHPYSLSTPPLLRTITGVGKEIIAKSLTADPPDLARTIQSVLTLIPDLDFAELDDPTSHSTAPDLAPFSAPVPEPVVTPQPAPTGTVTTLGSPASLHSDAPTVPDQAPPPHSWTEVQITPNASSPTAAPEVMPVPDPPTSLDPAPMSHPGHPIASHTAPEPAPVQEPDAHLTAADVTEPMTGNPVTATTTLTFTAFPHASAPCVDAEDTAAPEPHAIPAAALSVPNDAHLTPVTEPPMVTLDTATFVVTAPVVTPVIDVPAGGLLPDGLAAAGQLPWVAANRVATPEEVMAYLAGHPDEDGVIVSLEALQPFRLYMLDLEAFYRDHPDQKTGADFSEIREVARAAQEILLTLTTLTEEDFALLAPEARIIIESASRLLA